MKASILHINSYLISNKFYLNLFDELNREVQNHVIVFKNKNVSIPEYLFDYESREEKIKVFDTYGNVSRYFYHYRVFKNFKILKDYLKKNDIDIIHAHTLFTDGYLAYLLKKQYGLPYVVAVRNTDVNIFFKYRFLLRNTGIKILKEASKIIFINDDYKSKVLRKYVPQSCKEEIKSKSAVIPNGIDDLWFRALKRPRAVRTKSVDVLFVGRIDKNKNVESLAKAIQSLEKRYEIQLTVVGPSENKKIAKSLERYSFVHCLGEKTAMEIIDIMETQNIFAMVSHKETFGIVYIEALSQGLPIVYTEGEGVSSYFKEGEVGYSANPDSVESIKNALLSVIEKPIEFEGFNKVHDFSWDKIARKYLNVYYKLLK